MSLNTKFDELLDFPCLFNFKVIGNSDPKLEDNIVAVAQKHVVGNYAPSSRRSSKGTYNSVTIKVKVQDNEQVESLYIAFGAIPGVVRVL
jgi:putative lipoic acid-binding regulatory protein